MSVLIDKRPASHPTTFEPIEENLAAVVVSESSAPVEAAPANLPIWEQLGFAQSEKKESFLTRMERIAVLLCEIFADFAQQEKEKTALLKKNIQNATDTQANATSMQGNITLGTSLAGALVVGSSFLASNKQAQKVLPQLGNLLADSTGKFFGSGQDRKITLASSKREVDTRALDQATSESQSKANARREIQDALREVGQTIRNASQSN